jgi:YGGT family
MSDEEVDQKVVTEGPAVATGGPAVVTDQAAPQAAPAQETVRTDSRRVTATGPGASEMTRRIVVLVFGLIQLVIGLRIVLLLLDARQANGLVSWILDVSQVFVAPFDGILRTDNLHASGSVLDITAIVAFVGITILELIVIWAVGIFRREPG